MGRASRQQKAAANGNGSKSLVVLCVGAGLAASSFLAVLLARRQQQSDGPSRLRPRSQVASGVSSKVIPAASPAAATTAVSAPEGSGVQQAAAPPAPAPPAAKATSAKSGGRQDKAAAGGAAAAKRLRPEAELVPKPGTVKAAKDAIEATGPVSAPSGTSLKALPSPKSAAAATSGDSFDATPSPTASQAHAAPPTASSPAAAPAEAPAAAAKAAPAAPAAPAAAAPAQTVPAPAASLAAAAVGAAAGLSTAQPASPAAPVGDADQDVDGVVHDEDSDSSAGSEAAQEQEEEPEVPLNKFEREAEELMTQAAEAWNVHENKGQAINLSKAAMAALVKGEHRARMRAEVGSNLGDMYFAVQQFPEAATAIEAAIEAAEECADFPMTIKLCNNLGSILKKLNRTMEAVGLHRRAYLLAVEELGHSHDFTLLARNNYVSILGESGDHVSAEQVLAEATEAVKEEVARLEADLAAGTDGIAPLPATATGKGLGVKFLRAGADGKSPPTRSAQVKTARAALGRIYQDLGRLQMRSDDCSAAQKSFDVSLALYTDLFGPGTQETFGPSFSVAQCMRKAGRLPEALAAFQTLLVQSNAQGVDEGTIALTRILCEMSDELGDSQLAVQYSKEALSAMQTFMSSKGARAPTQLMAPYFDMVIKAMQKAGDMKGAEEMRRQMLAARAQEQGQSTRPRAAAPQQQQQQQQGAAPGKGAKAKSAKKAGGRK